MKYQPHPYQKEAIKFLVSRACAGLFLDPGLGKTSVTFASFKLLRRHGIDSMLVIAPLRPAHSVWPKEAEKWDAFNDLKVNVLHGPKKEERLREPADVYVVNPEGLPWLTRAIAGARPFPFDMLVVDESTRFKHTTTQRFKLIRPFIPKFKRRVILTGTPAPNGLQDLFGQIYILDEGNALGRYITHYRMLYFDNPDGQGWLWVPRAGAQEKIQQKLKPLVLRMDARDLLDLPPLVFNKVEVELPPLARKQYDQMEAMMLTQLQDGLVIAANAAAATMKCRQIANGGIYHEDGQKFTHIHEAKVDAVEEIVEELQGKPALVAYEFKHDLDRLLKRFPGTPWIGGGVAASRFREIEQRWNAGQLPLLFAQPQSVAHGLNLQGTAATVVMMAQLWDLEVRDQFIRRVWRQGQTERVVVHDIIATDTVDEAIAKGVAAKDRVQQNLLSALKDYSRARRR
jgi:SNF2 family DNA or RNA helicase